MPTPETSIWLALRKRVESLTLNPAHSVSWPNESFDPPQLDGVPSPYLMVNHLPNTTDRLFIGSNGPQRYQGILQISVMSKLLQNSSVAPEFAGQVAAHFPTDIKLEHGDIIVRVTKNPDISQGFRDDKANLWMTPVSVYYECFA